MEGSPEPTEKEVENEFARIKRKDYTTSLTTQDVITAFKRGDGMNFLDHTHENIVHFSPLAHQRGETEMCNL